MLRCCECAVNNVFFLLLLQPVRDQFRYPCCFSFGHAGFVFRIIFARREQIQKEYRIFLEDGWMDGWRMASILLPVFEGGGSVAGRIHIQQSVVFPRHQSVCLQDLTSPAEWAAVKPIPNLQEMMHTQQPWGKARQPPMQCLLPKAILAWKKNSIPIYTKIPIPLFCTFEAEKNLSLFSLYVQHCWSKCCSKWTSLYLCQLWVESIFTLCRPRPIGQDSSPKLRWPWIIEETLLNILRKRTPNKKICSFQSGDAYSTFSSWTDFC